jgi:hypothetical protein
MRTASTTDGLEGLGSSEDQDREYTGKFAEQGTPASGYEEHGPYHCEDCIHQQIAICYHPAVMIDPKVQSKKQDDGGIKVNLERGCCKFVSQPE